MAGLSDEDLMVLSELAFMSGLSTGWENTHKGLRVPLHRKKKLLKQIIRALRRLKLINICN